MSLKFRVASVKKVRPGSRKVVGTGKVLVGNRLLKKGDTVTFSGLDGKLPYFKPGDYLTGTSERGRAGNHISEARRPQGAKNQSRSRRA